MDTLTTRYCREPFAKDELGKTKTPDFRVYRNSDLVFYCESKHVQRDFWLEEQLHTAAPLQIVGGARPDPIFNRLATHIHEAAKQFRAVNPNQDFPNVLIFTNSDEQCGFADLVAVLTGNFYAEGGAVEPIYAQYSEGRIKDEKHTIDLYVWLNDSKGSNQKGSWFFNERSRHYATLCSFFGTDPRRHIKR